MTDEVTVDVIRHGRTAVNAERRFRGLHDVPLDEQGRAEAEAVARSLWGRPIVAIASSPLARARQTAEPLARSLGIDVVPLDGLVDLDHGAWTGLTEEEAGRVDRAELERFRGDPRASTPPDGERMVEVERRIADAVDDLARAHPGREIAIVTHEIPIRLLLSHVGWLDAASFWTMLLPTASVTGLRGVAGTWRVEVGPTAP